MKDYNQEKAYEKLANILTEIYYGDKDMYPEDFESAEGLVVTLEVDEDGISTVQLRPFTERTQITTDAVPFVIEP